MYCQNCHHDLRGQTVPRCLECGREFDPADPATYLAERTTVLRQVFRDRGVRVIGSLVAIGAVYLALIYTFVPGIRCSQCMPIPARGFSQDRLHTIVMAYLANGDTKGVRGRLTIDDVRHDLTPSWYSRAAAPAYERSNRWNRKASTWFTGVVLVVGPALAVAVIYRRRVRKVALVIVLACVAVGVGLVMSAYSVQGYMRRSSYDYLEDYVVVPTIDWRDMAQSSWTSIAAFEKHPWQNWWRVVARTPSEVRIMKERDFQKLLSEQPAAQEAWLDCVAAGECAGRRE
jgi:hypothetical protein